MSDTNDPQRAPDGYAIGYGTGKGQFRVYLCATAALAFAIVYALHGSSISLFVAVFLAIAAYYFYPLIEHGKARLGAGQYGVFIDGFGIIPWRAIDEITLSSYAIRSIIRNQIQIHLSRPLTDATIVDWRRPPLYRILMMLPWSMKPDNTIHINMEPFAGPPEVILHELLRRKKMYGGT